MSLSKTKRVARDLDRLLAHHSVELQNFAEDVRKGIVLPVCRKHGLGYLAGNGTMIFVGDYEGQEVTIGSTWEAKEQYEGRFKFLAPIFTCVLELEVAHNDYLGFYVGDVDRSRRGPDEVSP